MRSENIEILKLGGVGVAMTDTIYGILGSALRPKVVERIYQIKGRDENKPFIILISSMDDLRLFGVQLSHDQRGIIEKHWPGGISFVLPVHDHKFSYLLRGQKTLAFRCPNKTDLLEVLKIVGPLVAPSANPQGLAPAETIERAQEYFDDRVDFYESGELTQSEPSTIVTFEGNKLKVLRPGVVRVEENISLKRKTYKKRDWNRWNVFVYLSLVSISILMIIVLFYLW